MVNVLRYVGGVRRGEPILPRYGKHDPLILVQQESPRPDLAIARKPGSGLGPMLLQHAFAPGY